VAFEVEARAEMEEQLLGTLERLERGEPLEDTGESFASIDAELNRRYAQVLTVTPQHGSLSTGTVNQEGIRKTERAWLVYRDAFVAFAKQRYPRVPSEMLLATLTLQRIQLLKFQVER
jgi:uncharacterized protein YecT (DUF1311 family)